jgi:hypothetical protein
MPSLHIGTSRVQTVSASDGSTPAGVAAAFNVSGIVSVSVSGNSVTVTGVGTGTANVNYTAPGYLSALQTFTVAPTPSLVVTDGPEQ